MRKIQNAPKARDTDVAPFPIGSMANKNKNKLRNQFHLQANPRAALLTKALKSPPTEAGLYMPALYWVRVDVKDLLALDRGLSPCVREVDQGILLF
jgi:hypothetical protein